MTLTSPSLPSGSRYITVGRRRPIFSYTTCLPFLLNPDAPTAPAASPPAAVPSSSRHYTLSLTPSTVLLPPVASTATLPHHHAMRSTIVSRLSSQTPRLLFLGPPVMPDLKNHVSVTALLPRPSCRRSTATLAFAILSAACILCPWLQLPASSWPSLSRQQAKRRVTPFHSWGYR